MLNFITQKLQLSLKSQIFARRKKTLLILPPAFMKFASFKYFLSRFHDYTEDMATLATLAKIYSTEVTGHSKTFFRPVKFFGYVVHIKIAVPVICR